MTRACVDRHPRPWLRAQRRGRCSTRPGWGSLSISYDGGGHTARRDRLDAAITEVAGDSLYRGRQPAQLSTRDGHLTAFALAVQLGDWHG